MTEAEAVRVIRAEVDQLCKHPRMQGKSFGPSSAEELLYQLAHFLASREVKWPKPDTEGSDDAKA